MYKWVMAVLLSAACIVGVVTLIVQTNDHSKEVASEHEGGGAAAGGMPTVTLDAAAAETVFKQSCVACHGANLEGGAGPALKTIGSKLSDQQIYKKIQNGGGGMPKFKGQIKDEDTANLATWLASHK
ncbi:c-type cytochrome [Paenibacillus cymbidii]|uniref:c-type cytochrome n=1 Tax=Paenibacillus cymbidii TaxID=1639034 RepID=UPI001081E237|nr:cytochrome c [Paenibacillus cymbidii]